MSDLELDGEILAEEDAEPREGDGQALPLPYEGNGASLVLRADVKTAAIAAAGGVLAGAATVAAVRVVSAAGGKTRSPRRFVGRRRERVVASRSFLVDVHLLGR